MYVCLLNFIQMNEVSVSFMEHKELFDMFNSDMYCYGGVDGNLQGIRCVNINSKKHFVLDIMDCTDYDELTDKIDDMLTTYIDIDETCCWSDLAPLSEGLKESLEKLCPQKCKEFVYDYYKHGLQTTIMLVGVIPC